jgi:hypothetical protein
LFFAVRLKNPQKATPTMKKIVLSIAIGAAALLNAGAQVVIDFNSNATGQLAGQNGTLGLTGTWEGATAMNVDESNLTSTYSIAQTGTAQKLQGASIDPANAAAYISLSSNATGTVYFSFLAQLGDSGGRTGFIMNSSLASPAYGYSVILVGDVYTPGLFYRSFGTTVGTGISIADGNQTDVQFIVGQIDFQSSGVNDTLQLWINPDLSGGTLGTADFYSSTIDIGTDLSVIGAFAYGGATPSAIDNIRIGSSLADVAVIPAPTTLASGNRDWRLVAAPPSAHTRLKPAVVLSSK